MHLGDDDDEVTFSSATPIEEGDTFLFAPRGLKNLAMVDEMDSLSPILTTQVRLLVSNGLKIKSTLSTVLDNGDDNNNKMITAQCGLTRPFIIPF